MAFKTNRETPEAEAARLAQSPEGSTNHRLSQMPVTITADIKHMLIEIPRFGNEPDYTVVVVPTESYVFSGHDPEVLPRPRYQSSWSCIVVASNHPSYPVGCWPLSLPEYQLRRGVQRTIGL